MARLSGGSQRQAPSPPRPQRAHDERLVLDASGAAARGLGPDWAEPEAGMLRTMLRTRAPGVLLAAKRAFLRPRAASMEVNSAAHRLGGFPFAAAVYSQRVGSLLTPGLASKFLSGWRFQMVFRTARTAVDDCAFPSAILVLYGSRSRESGIMVVHSHWHANPATSLAGPGASPRPHLHQDRKRCTLTDHPAAITRYQSPAEVSFDKMRAHVRTVVSEFRDLSKVSTASRLLL